LEPLLAAPRDCNILAQQTCDCFDPTDDLAGVNTRKKPLCQGEDGYGTVQLRAKAYPGIRHLEVVRGLESEGYAASICPKVLDDEFSPYYGYAPAVRGLLGKFRRILN
jgi:hypothetical protein